MKDQKMLSVRIASSKFTDFKDFCTENDLTMKDVITKLVDLTLEARKYEKAEQK